MPASKPEKKSDSQNQRAWMKYAGMTTQLAISIGICAGLGLYLDGYFDTKPILTVILSLVGVFGGLYLALKDLL
ncbi:MAG: AtpZ/AtpI family protein [Bacteroidota bacterium]